MMIIPIIITEEEADAFDDLLDLMEMELKDWAWVAGFFILSGSVSAALCYFIPILV